AETQRLADLAALQADFDQAVADYESEIAGLESDLADCVADAAAAAAQCILDIDNALNTITAVVGYEITETANLSITECLHTEIA
ncbi:MAG: hypothetical protein ACKO96_48035, partial [Flammeovirgaceae bacterium]